MLSAPPWSAYPLGITLYSEKAEAWWERAKIGGAVGRTEAAWKKWEKTRGAEEVTGREVEVKRIFQGVDGMSGTAEGEEGEGKICIDDGTYSSYSCTSSWD
jgi:hypothetical protein